MKSQTGTLAGRRPQIRIAPQLSVAIKRRILSSCLQLEAKMSALLLGSRTSTLWSSQYFSSHH
jgi:hypothetical protein